MSNSIIRWNPLREMSAMKSAMDRIFEETWRPLFESGDLNMNMLALDVHEDENVYTVVTELPGVKPEDIHVKMDGDYLIIEGEIPEQTIEKEGTRTLVRERRYGHYSRRIRLPQSVDAHKVEANYDNGLLTLTLPKAEESKPKAIPIKVSKT